MSGDHRVRSLFVNPVIGATDYIDCHSTRSGDFSESVQFVADRPVLEGLVVPMTPAMRAKAATASVGPTPQNVTFFYFTPDGYSKMQRLVAYLRGRDRLEHLSVLEDPDKTFYPSILLLPLSLAWKAWDEAEPYFVEVSRGNPD